MPSEFIPLSIPHLAGKEWDYIKDCLDTGWVSSVGSYVGKFESEFAQAVGTNHAVACVNGTAALHIALLVLGVKPGDQVLVSDLTFIASANAIRYTGATPVFIDAEPDYWQMDVNIVRRYLHDECTRQDGSVIHRPTGQTVAAIMPVHILGHPVEMDQLHAISAEWGLPIVEDATESLGAKYRTKSAGALGDLAAFSFNGNKLITTGGGGMITTNDPVLAQKAKHLTTTAKIEPVEFIHDGIGYNYRLNNVLAAMGCAQLEMLSHFLAKKKQIAKRYQTAFQNLPQITTMPTAPGVTNALWLYTIRLKNQSSRPLLQHLERLGIQTRPLWQPMHLSPAHSDLPPRQCPVAEQLNAECLSLPCSVGLTDDDHNRVIQAIREYFK